jgi:hypothetical protein
MEPDGRAACRGDVFAFVLEKLDGGYRYNSEFVVRRGDTVLALVLNSGTRTRRWRRVLCGEL